MTIIVPRLRMFAGPNGSGKSVIKAKLRQELIGYYINADEIEQEVKNSKCVKLGIYGLNAHKDSIRKFFSKSKLLAKSGLIEKVEQIEFADNMISFQNIEMNSYFASVCADYIRNELLVKRESFTFETVMSAEDKIEILKKAQELGYRTYLYYVSTEDYIINENRVKNRVSDGGHDVPIDKIKSRYYRSMDNLSEAIKYTNRAYIFDNSRDNPNNASILIAEITDAVNIEIKAESIPVWFDRYVLDKFIIKD